MKNTLVIIFTIIAFQATAQPDLAVLRGPITQADDTLVWTVIGTDDILEWDMPSHISPIIPTRQSYRSTLDCKQLAIWGLFAASGVLWGAREAYHADRRVFEKNYDVAPESFWGSEAWKRNYVDNDPEQPHKHEYFGNVGRDVWHTFGFASNALLFSGTFIIGARKQPLKYRAVNALLGWGARSMFASLTYNALK